MRGGSAPDAIDAFAGRTDASGGGFVVEPRRPSGGGFVVEPVRPAGGGFVVEPARPGGAKPCEAFVGVGAAANPAAVLVVDVSGVLDERSCAGNEPEFVDDGRVPDDVGRVIGALADGGNGAAGARTVVDVTSGPPTTVASALRPASPPIGPL